LASTARWLPMHPVEHPADMAAKTPTYRSIALGPVLLQVFLAIAAATLGVSAFRDHDPLTGIIVGCACYVLFYMGSPRVLANDQRRGMALVRRREFAEAARHFEASLDFFCRHQWVDRWRCAILGNCSSMTYREMAICNAAFCYSQIGEGKKAMQYYERALIEFPDSALANAALNMIRSVQSISPKADA
jgi:tetratricopeptide (TPR) repeat protein